MYQALVLPGQAAEENCGVIPLKLGEWQFNRAVEVTDFLALDARLLLEPLALGFEALPKQIFSRQDVKQFAGVLRVLRGCNGAHYDRLQSGLVSILNESLEIWSRWPGTVTTRTN
jgi:hypothetical protein